VSSRSRWAGGSVLHQTPWSFGFDSQTTGTSQGKQTHPVLKYLVSSRVPGARTSAVMGGAGGCGLLAGTRQWPAAEDGVPPSLQIQSHTCVSAASFPFARPLLPSRAQTGPPDIATSPVIVLYSLTRPLCPFVCVSAASFPCWFSDLGLNFLLASAYCTREHT
jgi:hypothetical protein